MLDSILPIVGIVIVLGAVIGIVASRYKIADPTEALIITGRSKKALAVTTAGEDGASHVTHQTDLSGQRVIIGGGGIVLPLVQQYQKISLQSQSIEIKISSVPSSDGILLDVEAVAIIKVGGTEESVRLAAQRFGGDLDEIKLQTVETMSGALRGIVGKMTVQSIIGDRERFAQEAVAIAQETLTNQGLALDTFQIRTISDNNDYLVNLGRPEAASVLKRAKISEQTAFQESEEKRIEAEKEVAVAQRLLSLQEASIKAETDKALAEAGAAQPLEVAQQQQKILEQARKVEQQKAQVKEEELVATVRKPADAKRYETEQDADAERYRTEQAAEASKKSAELNAEAKAKQDEFHGQGQVSLAEAEAQSREKEARANLALAKADAESITLRGDAEASAIRAKGEAEAEAMEKRADAFSKYGQAAILETVVSILPEIAKPFADAYSGIDNMSIIDNNGASKLGKSMSDNMAQVQDIVKATTGIDFNSILREFAPGAADGSDSVATNDSPLEGNVSN